VVEHSPQNAKIKGSNNATNTGEVKLKTNLIKVVDTLPPAKPLNDDILGNRDEEPKIKKIFYNFLVG